MADKSNAQSRPRRLQGFILSLLAHGIFLCGLLWIDSCSLTGPAIIAAGPGERFDEAVEVGILGRSEWLKFKAQYDVASVADQASTSPIPETLARPAQPPPEEAEIVPPFAPKHETQPPADDARTTDRPRLNDSDRPYTTNRAAGASPSMSALLGSGGSPLPSSLRGGIGLGPGAADWQAIAGGSEYGRRLQRALIGYYRLAPGKSLPPRFVIVRLRIARSGRVLSLQRGRLQPEAVIRNSRDPVIDARVTAALLELDRHPIPFPPGFMPGIREASAQIYFQY